ncbi:C2H2 type zinc-finger-domain-containing protein [Lophiotrema nucula]|uniref:C2H2 type zinc-finger-domain-containing protein n=1 Tax=Lophiotrema nucula TaxID=690887 RepID=A0A6A5YTW8_9PLEO|nr:C2H2 type zinc-finger-domain-containing protein [Lophiotrema nucula]
MGETGGNTTQQNCSESFNSLECLFCRQQSPSIDSNMHHMLKRHGLFIEDKSKLIVEAETLLEYLHLIISTYCECIYCGTQRSSAQAIRQHMMGKGHCKFDLSRADSEFRDFYDFDQFDNDAQKEKKEKISRMMQEDESYGPTRKDRKHRLFRLKSSIQANDILEWKPPEPVSSTVEETTSPSTSLTRAEKRGGTFTKQLSHIRASDRTSFQQLPASSQRALLGTYQKSVECTKREESRKQTRLERAVNKTLVQSRYYKTENPVYQCG